MDQIIGALIFILLIIAHIIKSIRDTVPPKSPDAKRGQDSDVVIITQSKQSKQSAKPTKPSKKRLTEQSPLWNDRSVFDNTKTEAPRQKALVKKLSPQGEGQRFAVDPGTLDTTNIVAPTFDPTVKPELDSITGIYERGVMFGESAQPAITLNITDWLARPESLCQAVICAEILNRPAWQEVPSVYTAARQ